jgi:hypothetical protein
MLESKLDIVFVHSPAYPVKMRYLLVFDYYTNYPKESADRLGCRLIICSRHALPKWHFWSWFCSMEVDSEIESVVRPLT